MSDSEIGTPLAGGRTTSGVVRVGDTVRRPAAPNAALVRRLLRHLARRGFNAAPEMLSTDDLGREMFTYVDGEVPRDLAFHDDATLRAAATLIRRFHDLAAEVLSSSERATAEVVCHHDLSPCNFVFRDGVPVAIIDFDAAAPGMRVADVAYAAWLWLDIGSPDVDAAEQRRRLLVFLQAYGPIDVAVVVDAMLERQASLAREGEQAVGAAMAEWAAASLGWTQTHRAVLPGRGPER